MQKNRKHQGLRFFVGLEIQETLLRDLPNQLHQQTPQAAIMMMVAMAMMQMSIDTAFHNTL